MSSSVCETSLSLIERLGSQEPRAWEDFATKYTWMMRRWLTSWEIPVDEVEDLLQDSCLRVFRNIHKFQHRGNGSFRAWLKEVSRSCWLQVIRKSAYRARLEQKQLDLAVLISEETLWRIDHEIDLLIEQELFLLAISRTRKQFKELVWESYRLTVLEGSSGALVSQALGISLDLVYKNKERFERRLEDELRSLRALD
jgi:RNA polymerase sigma factor (sigma-70 family)